jgi:membrane protease YdiL (CAAX protease family)
MLIAFALGLVMALTYRKTRDLKANIIAHFLIDFISNVLPLLTK